MSSCPRDLALLSPPPLPMCLRLADLFEPGMAGSLRRFVCQSGEGEEVNERGEGLMWTYHWVYMTELSLGVHERAITGCT